MRRAPVLFFALCTALLAACGVSLEQTAVAPVASVEMPEPHAEAEGRHAYLHRLGGHAYVSLSPHGPQGGLPILMGTQHHAHAIRLLAADPAQVRAILRSLRLPANQRKLWAGEEIALDAASYDMLQAARGSNKPLFAELRLVGIEK
ncbi:hypothetical protein [Janthinobacterium sp. JC611]|uniref:hypothetical protein n=1 Tax=Janthinobacterium sp. JC611 TaxID=2816201 RepID=UPI001BFE0D05|nr:hypothetical protein [Janthinobacterium sp. JC611]